MVTLHQTNQKRVVRNIDPKERCLQLSVYFGSVFWLTWPKYACSICQRIHLIYVNLPMHIDGKVAEK